MLLLSCHIENFGPISGADYDFAPGITELCEKNGFGKTTLAAFIKAMLYGMPDETARSRAFGERQHFYPFSGGKFGGNLSFEAGGKQYRIERFFDRKSGSRDTLALFCMERPVPETDPLLVKGPGEALFGIDRDSFEKTAFVTAREFETGSTDSIDARMNRVPADPEGEENFRNAVERLEKAAKELKAARGAGGRIAQQAALMTGLDAEIANAEKIEEGLQHLYAERNRLGSELLTLQRREEAEKEARLIRQKRETYDRYRQEAEEKRRQLEALRERYPSGLPSAEEIAVLRDAADRLLQDGSAAAGYTFSEAKRAQLAEGEAVFRDGLPADAEFERIRQKIEEKERLGRELTELRARLDTIREGETVRRFQNGTPDAAAMTRAKTELLQSREMRQQAETFRKAEGGAAGKAGIVFFLAAAALLAGGLVWSRFAALPGLLTAAAGLALFLLLAGLAIRRKKQGAACGAERERLLADAAAREEAVRRFLRSFGYAAEASLAETFALLERDLGTFEKERERIGELQRREEETGLACRRLAGDVTAFLGRYGFRGDGLDLREALLRLRQAAQQYAQLQNEKTEISRRREQYALHIAAEREACTEILSRYGIQPAFEEFQKQIAGLEMDQREIGRLEAELAEKGEQARRYREENGLAGRQEDAPGLPETASEPGPDSDFNSEILSERISETQRAIVRLDRQIEEDEKAAERLLGLVNQREVEKERLEEYRKRYDILTKARSFLEQAEQNLKERYVAPVRDRFCAYAGLLGAAFGKTVRMDTDFRLTFEGGGESRKEQHLSAGQRALWLFCFRLAILDCLYEEEKPFLVLDDPFVSLDAEHMEKAAALLRQLAAQGFQILYFSCHESRSLSS